MSRVERNWPALVLLLASLSVFYPFTLGGQALFWGTPILQFYPWRNHAYELIRGGHWPLWTPDLGMGTPLIANYQLALFYPLNWPLMLAPLDFGLGWLAALHVVLAGLGMIALARRLGFGRLGQCLSALSFALSGYVVARMGFITINNAVAWLPWLVWAGEGLAHGRRFRGAISLGLLLGLQLLAGHAQIAWYSILLVCGWVGWRGGPGFRIQDPGAGDRKSVHSYASRLLYLVLGLALAGALAVALAALQLLPTAELARASQRAEGADYDFVANYSFWPWRLITLAAPDFFGSPAEGDYKAYGNYWEDAIYVGLLPLLLAIGALLGRLRDRLHGRKREASLPVFFLFAVMAASLVIALGYNTPVFPFLFRYAPIFNAFQAPARMLVWFVFALALLAGWSADRWKKPEGRALYWTRLGTAGAAAVVAVALAIGASSTVRSSFVRASALAGGWAAASGLLSLLKSRSDSTRWSLAVAGVVAADLVVAGWGLNPSVPVSVYRNSTKSGEFARSYLQGHRAYVFEVDEQALRFERFFQFDNFHSRQDWYDVREAQVPNLSLLDHFSSANNFDPLLPARYAAFTSALQNLPGEQAAHWLALMDVGLVIREIKDTPSQPAYTGPDAEFFPALRPPARIRLVDQVVLARTPAEVLERMTEPGFDPDLVAILEADDTALHDEQTASQIQTFLTGATQAMGRTAPAGPGQASLDLSRNPNKVVVSAKTERDTLLVLSDLYYPGWEAALDGSPVPILRADFAFRAILLPAGRHEVVFQYRPGSFYSGVRLSLAAWALVGVYGVVRMVKWRR